MKLGDCYNTLKIDMVRTATGCPEACLHCGAYTSFDNVHDFSMTELSRSELKENLERAVEGTRLKIADVLAKYVTTDVNVEPLRGNVFCDLAELVYDLTDGRSKTVCISHGVRYSSKSMNERMEKVVGLMLEGKVPLFVLTVDTARNKARISDKANIKGYAKTLEALKPVLDMIAIKKELKDEDLPDLRVTISLQGEDSKESLIWRQKAAEHFQEAVKRSGLSASQRDALVWDRERPYAKVGRADIYLHGQEEGECPVIPDIKFVKKFLPFDNIHRGMIDIKGKVYRQLNERLRTYNTSLNPAAWEFLENGGGNSGRDALPIFGEDKYVDVSDLFEDSDEDTESFEDPDDTGDKKKSEESLAVTTRVHSGMRRTYKRRTPKQEKKDSVKKTKKKQDDFGLSPKVFSRGFRRKALSDRTIGSSVQLEDGMSGTDD